MLSLLWVIQEQESVVSKFRTSQNPKSFLYPNNVPLWKFGMLFFGGYSRASVFFNSETLVACIVLNSLLAGNSHAVFVSFPSFPWEPRNRGGCSSESCEARYPVSNWFVALCYGYLNKACWSGLLDEFFESSGWLQEASGKQKMKQKTRNTSIPTVVGYCSMK